MQRSDSPKTRYDSRVASMLHTITCGYIAGDNNFDETEKYFKQVLESRNRTALGYVSDSGHTHLFDAVHLSHTDMCSTPELGKLKARKLLNMYAELATQSALRKNPEIFSILLLTNIQNGLTPLHQLVLNKDPECLKTYLQILQKALVNNCINKQDIVDLFSGRAFYIGSTVMHMVMATNDKQIADVVADFLMKSFKENAANVANDLLYRVSNKKNQAAASLNFQFARYLMKSLNKVLKTNTDNSPRSSPEPSLRQSISKERAASRASSTSNVFAMLSYVDITPNELMQEKVTSKKKKCPVLEQETVTPDITPDITPVSSCSSSLASSQEFSTPVVSRAATPEPNDEFSTPLVSRASTPEPNDEFSTPVASRASTPEPQAHASYISYIGSSIYGFFQQASVIVKAPVVAAARYTMSYMSLE